MDQVLQDLRRGTIRVEQVPPPKPGAREVLVRNVFSVISPGTERAKVETGRKSLLGKALARPDQVRLVIQKIRQEGIASAFHKVKERLETPSPIGYSCAGVVVETGSEVTAFKPGDRVACAGAQAAFHAEYVSVPVSLCAKVPASIGLDIAAASTLGAIALQGVRQADVRVGEKVLVIGLGLLGQLTAQILRSAGASVFGLDLDPRKVALAQSLGMDAGDVWGAAHVPQAIQTFTQGMGVDAVILTAASASGELAVFAGEQCRDRGRLVVVGQVPVELPRSPFYEKELTVLYSRSYGPGRYDALYEEGGIDYPVGYVRWTENRNLQAFLDLLARGSVKMDTLLTHRFPLAEASTAFDLISQPAADPVIGVLLTYPATSETVPATRIEFEAKPHACTGAPRIAVIGAGNFASAHLLPALAKRKDIQRVALCAQHGHKAAHAARRYGFDAATADAMELLHKGGFDGVLIATRHDTHATFVQAALNAGASVFVEKPLCLTLDELGKIRHAAQQAGRSVMVGFNRRFAPLAQTLRTQLQPLPGPRLLTYRINAGALPADHWLKDPERGGGRILGEVCHFVDLACWLINRPVTQVFATAPEGARGEEVAATLSFADGSQAQILYTARGASGLEKERIEVFCAGQAFVLNNFQQLEIFRGKKAVKKRLWAPDKGFATEVDAWLDSLKKGGDAPIPTVESLRTTELSFLILDSLATGRPVPAPQE